MRAKGNRNRARGKCRVICSHKKHPPAQALKYISGEHFISISQDVKEMRLPRELLSLSKHLDSFQKGANYRANTQPLPMRRKA